MRRGLVLAVTLAAPLLGLRGEGAAHVAPSVDDNNRYVKLTPLGDRVRIAYVVFFGEVPGARLRPSIDADHDGSLSEAEARAFGARLGGEIAAALDVSIDGSQRPVAWTTVSVGLGSPQVVAGAFSVDLVAFLCLPAARGRHEVRLFDRFRVERPGETEVRVEDGPGISIERARVGELSDPARTYRFAGPGGPLSDAGLEVAFTAGDASIVAPDATCPAADRGGGGRTRTVIVGGGAAAAGAVLAGLAIRRARRRRRAAG